MPFPPNDGGSVAIYNTSIGLIENDVRVNLIAINPSRYNVNEDILIVAVSEIEKKLLIPGSSLSKQY